MHGAQIQHIVAPKSAIAVHEIEAEFHQSSNSCSLHSLLCIITNELGPELTVVAGQNSTFIYFC